MEWLRGDLSGRPADRVLGTERGRVWRRGRHRRDRRHWIIEDSTFQYNTSDGLDLLYVREEGSPSRSGAQWRGQRGRPDQDLWSYRD